MSRPTSWLYFIQCGDRTGPIKIGYAANVDYRRSNLQMGCPYRLTLLASIPAGDASAAAILEASLHERFAELRMRGEWYRFDPSIIAAMDRMLEAVGGDSIARVARLMGMGPEATRRRPIAGPLKPVADES